MAGVGRRVLIGYFKLNFKSYLLSHILLFWGTKYSFFFVDVFGRKPESDSGSPAVVMRILIKVGYCLNFAAEDNIYACAYLWSREGLIIIDQLSCCDRR